MNGYSTELSGTIRITAPVNLGERFLAGWLTAFQHVHPDIIIDLVLSDRSMDLIQEGIDIALRIGHLPDSELVARKIGDVHGVLCASPAYLEKHCTPEEPAQLARHSTVIYSWRQDGRPTQLTLTRGTLQKTVELRGTFFANHVGAIHQAVLDGAGFHAGPIWLFGDAIREGRLVPVLTDWQLPVLPVHILRLKHPYVPARFSALSDWLVDSWKNEPLLALKETAPSHSP